VPLCARFDTVGPLCRSVEDAALLLALMEGGRPADLRGAR
jgi:aspartyl-tRNA(Asn)/glutamyl-tRNA(Gln) amidotransferase subunit A